MYALHDGCYIVVSLDFVVLTGTASQAVDLLTYHFDSFEVYFLSSIFKFQ